MNIGTKIKQLREAKNLSQKDLSNEVGMTQANLHKLESDKIKAKLDTAEKIAAYFGVTLDELRGVEKQSVKIEHNENNLNQKVSAIMLNFSDDEIIELLKKQLADKDIIITLQAEKIKLLEK